MNTDISKALRNASLIAGCVAAVAAVLLMAPPLSSQQKQEPKPFKPPMFLLSSPLLAKDEGCAKDLAKAVHFEGLEQRKYLVDLFVFGCIQRVPGLYRANILDFRKYGEGQASVSMRKVYLIDPVTGKDTTGWVLADELISQQTIDAVIKSLPPEGKKK